MWILIIICFVFFIGCSLCNANVFYKYYVKKIHGSTIPIIGAFAGTIAVLLLPIEGAKDFWWIPWVIDTGGVLWIVLVIYKLMSKAFQKK